MALQAAGDRHPLHPYWSSPYADRCLPSVILSKAQAQTLVAWLGGTPPGQQLPFLHLPS